MELHYCLLLLSGTQEDVGVVLQVVVSAGDCPR